MNDSTERTVIGLLGAFFLAFSLFLGLFVDLESIFFHEILFLFEEITRQIIWILGIVGFGMLGYAILSGDSRRNKNIMT